MSRLYLLPFLFACGSITPPPERCGESFTVLAPELLEASEAAAARWSAATGCEVFITPENGIPIRFATDEELDLKRGNGRLAIAVTNIASDGSINYIGYSTHESVESNVTSQSLTHEMGHALGCHQHTEEDGLSVLDRFYSENGTITDAALSCVCNKLECAQFQPEQLPLTLSKILLDNERRDVIISPRTPH